jgi:DNA-binding LacI/PurR family transcriptional regulator
MASNRKPTMYDVGKRAGVSSATVSFILNGRGGGGDRISEETRQRVNQAISDLGYVPNQSARALRRQKTDRVCLVIPQIGTPFSDGLANSVQSVADVHGYNLILAMSGSRDREHHVFDQLRRGLADGAVIFDPEHLGDEELEQLAHAGVALVVQCNRVLGKSFDVVKMNETQSLQDAVRYLCEHGRRRIACLFNVIEPSIQEDRLQCYLQTVRELGLPIIEPFVLRQVGRLREQVYRSVSKLLQSPDHPDAILAGSDMFAISAVWAIRDAGLRVPEDIAVIGIGNIPEGEITHPPLTTVGLVTPTFSDLTGLLFSRLASQVPMEGRVVMHQWELILRGSA